MRAVCVSLFYCITNISIVFIFSFPHMLALPLNPHKFIHIQRREAASTIWPTTSYNNKDKVMNGDVLHNCCSPESVYINLENLDSIKSKPLSAEKLKFIVRKNTQIYNRFRCKRSTYFVNQDNDMFVKFFNPESAKIIRKRSPLDKSTFVILPAGDGDNVRVTGIAHHSTVVTHDLSGASGVTHVIRTHSSKQNNRSVNVLSRVIPHGKTEEVQDITSNLHYPVVHSLVPNPAVTKSEVTVTMHHPLPSKAQKSTVKVQSADDLVHSSQHISQSSPVEVIQSEVLLLDTNAEKSDILFPAISSLSDNTGNHLLATVISENKDSSVVNVPLVPHRVLPHQDIHVLLSAELKSHDVPEIPEVAQVVLKETTFHVPSTPEIVHHLPVRPISHVTVSRTTAKFKLRVLNKNIYRSHLGGFGVGIDVGGHGAGHGYYAYG